MIKNLSDLAAEIGCKPDCIGKALYKGTQCGICFHEDIVGVQVSGYAEGADAECSTIHLEYPFTAKQFWDAVQEADDEGKAMWHEWNDQEEEIA